MLSQELTSGAQASQVEQGIREKLMRLLEARVGQGNAVVEVSVRQNPTQEVVRETIIDPESRVAITQEIEQSSNERNSAGQTVGVASNLPENPSTATGGLDTQSRMRETVAYEISQKEHETINAAGGIDRISVAVLINENVLSDSGGGRIGNIDKLQDLVASAAGIDLERGDVVTVETMPFSETAPFTLPTSPDVAEPSVQLFNPLLIGAAFLALLSIVIGFLFIKRPQAAQPPTSETASQDAITLLQDEATPPPSADPEKRLRALIGENEDRTVMLLKSWLEEGEKA